MTMEVMRQQKRMWALLYSLAKALVNYRQQNKAGIGSCNCPLTRWQSWKKVCRQYFPLCNPSWEINKGDFASKTARSFKNSQYIQKYQRASHCLIIFQGTDTCMWLYSPATYLLNSKLIVPALLRRQYIQKAVKLTFIYVMQLSCEQKMQKTFAGEQSLF